MKLMSVIIKRDYALLFAVFEKRIAKENVVEDKKMKMLSKD